MDLFSISLGTQLDIGYGYGTAGQAAVFVWCIGRDDRVPDFSRDKFLGAGTAVSHAAAERQFYAVGFGKFQNGI